MFSIYFFFKRLCVNINFIQNSQDAMTTMIFILNVHKKIYTHIFPRATAKLLNIVRKIPEKGEKKFKCNTKTQGISRQFS